MMFYVLRMHVVTADLFAECECYYGRYITIVVVDYYVNVVSTHEE